MSFVSRRSQSASARAQRPNGRRSHSSSARMAFFQTAVHQQQLPMMMHSNPPASPPTHMAIAFSGSDCSINQFTHVPYISSAPSSMGYSSDDSIPRGSSISALLKCTYPSSYNESDVSPSPTGFYGVEDVSPVPLPLPTATQNRAEDDDKKHDGWVLCAGHRCEHKKSHVRLRGRKGLIFFVCSECSTTWRLARAPTPTQSEVESVDMFAWACAIPKSSQEPHLVGQAAPHLRGLTASTITYQTNG
eukprot:NODE_2971_length_1304_cov_125.520745_g2822_i0.p1 GENE.NODE_2971_length_1304_cov_125.520745_g2822_i0~~NODE_2971_length_1304_cov_125.520745_g2822_i0.p1  ORF type:complete len:271 (-),score=49.40 NODE_2971_length_1304_cov_125.520745_g2822_i0:491-1228(-)